MAALEIFTPTGVLAGEAPGVPLTEAGPDLESPLDLADARWYPLDGGRPVNRGDVRVVPDEILLVVAGEQDLTVHMSWYAITLDVGPYRVNASIGTMPGFDPERALARPGGTYVPLRDATIELLGRSDVAPAQRPHLAVNRYAVEHCDCSLMLGFHFPGAQFDKQQATPVA
jgi:hypothetical protein